MKHFERRIKFFEYTHIFVNTKYLLGNYDSHKHTGVCKKTINQIRAKKKKKQHLTQHQNAETITKY